MRAPLYLLIGMAALVLSACQSEKEQTTVASPEKLAQYTKQISGKWHFDRPFMDREMKAYQDTVFRIANENQSGMGNYAVSYLNGFSADFLEEIKHTKWEFLPDGTLLSTYYHDTGPTETRYAFSNDLDSLFFLNGEGGKYEAYKIASMSDTAFVLFRDLYLPTKELANRRFFKARCKYVPE